MKIMFGNWERNKMGARSKQEQDVLTNVGWKVLLSGYI